MIKDSEEEMSSSSAFRLFGTTISLPADDVISVQNGCCLQSQDATAKLFNPDSSIISVRNECCRKRSATDLQTQGSNSQEKSAKVFSPESKAESLIKYPVKRIKSQESDPGKSSPNVLEEHNLRLGSENALRFSRSSSSCTQSFINDPIKRFKCQESEEQLNPRNALFLSCSSSSHKTASNGDPETEFSASKSEESSTNEDAFAESLRDDDENSFEISENAFLLTKSLLSLKNAKSEDLETEISKRGFADLQRGENLSGMEKSSAILLNPEENEGDNSKTCLSSESSENALRFSRSLPFLQKGHETAISSAKGASAYLQRCEKTPEMEKSSAILSKKEENEEENSRKCLSSENSENELRFRRSLPFLQASKNEGHKTATSSAKAAVPYPRRGETEKSSANGGENLKEFENALRFGRSLPFSAVNCVTETSSSLCLQKSSKTEKSSPNGEKIFAEKGEENARASLGFGNALRFTGSMPFLRLPKKETEISAENTSRYAKLSDENDNDTETGHAKAAKTEKPAMQCPRCSSVETKFCYYNNYNVNQPRYFCKNCRRYWTAGGTMRNIPIGAGRRKNKQHQLFQTKAPPIHPKESSAVDSPLMNNAAVDARRASSCHGVSGKQGAVSYGCSPWTFAAQNPRTAYLSTFYGAPPPLLQKHSRP